MDVFIYAKNAILFCFSMENNEHDVNSLRKTLRLNLNIHDNRKCEYCDWNNNDCEWCGKRNRRNKRKLEAINYEKKKRNNTI